MSIKVRIWRFCHFVTFLFYDILFYICGRGQPRTYRTLKQIEVYTWDIFVQAYSPSPEETEWVSWNGRRQVKKCPALASIVGVDELPALFEKVYCDTFDCCNIVFTLLSCPSSLTWGHFLSEWEGQRTPRGSRWRRRSRWVARGPQSRKAEVKKEGGRIEGLICRERTTSCSLLACSAIPLFFPWCLGSKTWSWVNPEKNWQVCHNSFPHRALPHVWQTRDSWSPSTRARRQPGTLLLLHSLVPSSGWEEAQGWLPLSFAFLSPRSDQHLQPRCDPCQPSWPHEQLLWSPCHPQVAQLLLCKRVGWQKVWSGGGDRRDSLRLLDWRKLYDLVINTSGQENEFQKVLQCGQGLFQLQSTMQICFFGTLYPNQCPFPWDVCPLSLWY